MTQPEVNAIQRSVIASVEDVFKRHDINEGILIFKIPYNRQECKIAIAYAREKNQPLKLEVIYFQIQEILKQNSEL